MTNGAILRLALVLLAIVIERRDDFDHFRVDYIERRLAYGSSRRRVIDRLVQVLLGTSTRPDGSQQNESNENYSL